MRITTINNNNNNNNIIIITRMITTIITTITTLAAISHKTPMAIKERTAAIAEKLLVRTSLLTLAMTTN